MIADVNTLHANIAEVHNIITLKQVSDTTYHSLWWTEVFISILNQSGAAQSRHLSIVEKINEALQAEGIALTKRTLNLMNARMNVTSNKRHSRKDYLKSLCNLTKVQNQGRLDLVHFSAATHLSLVYFKEKDYQQVLITLEELIDSRECTADINLFTLSQIGVQNNILPFPIGEFPVTMPRSLLCGYLRIVALSNLGQYSTDTPEIILQYIKLCQTVIADLKNLPENEYLAKCFNKAAKEYYFNILVIGVGLYLLSANICLLVGQLLIFTARCCLSYFLYIYKNG
jgi:hypothetical protein